MNNRAMIVRECAKYLSMIEEFDRMIEFRSVNVFEKFL